MDSRKQDDSDAFFYLREGVLERLLQAQAHLPAGPGFLVVEGYRPPALQRHYFEEYAACRLRRSRRTARARRWILRSWMRTAVSWIWVRL